MSDETISGMQIPVGLPCGQFIYQAEGDQNILYADLNVAHLYGCGSVEEFIEYIGNSFRNMVHPDDLEEAENSIKAQTLESGHRHDYLRYRIITKQRDIRYIEDFGHLVFDQNGNGYYYVFIVDVTKEEYFNDYYNSFAEGQVDAMNWKVDHLTGLKSIIAFQEELETSTIDSGNDVCTVAVFDIIGLQEVNRSQGRIEGDKRIRSLVQTVSAHMPKDCLLYRGYDAEIIAVCKGKREQEVIGQIKETARSCQSRVFFGVSSTAGALVNTDHSRKKGTILQALEEAQYDLNVKKMLNAESARSQALTSLVRALEEVDQDTEEHVERTRNMGIALGKRLGLSDVQLTTLELMCLLHDIGKIAVPLEILNKPGKLTDAEWAVLRSHADKGYQIAIASDELRPISEYIRYHHERWDGRGYPAKLSGEDIPVLSRIISIVDAYDAMVNDRCYRKALSSEYAMKEIRDNAGTQFDPHMAMVFLQLLSESPELALGKKTGGGEVQVFKKADEQSAALGNTQPVIYTEYRLDVNDQIIEVGPSFEAITGYSSKDAIGKMGQLDLIPEEDRDDYQVQVGNQFASGNTAYLRHRIRRKDGSDIYVICHGERHFDSATRSFMATVQIYETVGGEEEYGNKMLEERLIYARLHALAGNFIVVYVVDPETERYREFSSKSDYPRSLAKEKEGTGFFEKVREAASQYNHPADRNRFLSVFTKENVLEEVDRNGIFMFGYRLLMNGKPIHVQLKAAMAEEKEGPRLIVGLYDIDAQVRQEEELRMRLAQAQSLADLDALTGVKNKHAYLEAEALIDHQIADRHESPFAIVLLDVNDLKEVNDTSGLQAGDQYLQDACRIICDIFKHSPVFRVGGDEFAVIAQGNDYMRIEERLGKVRDHNSDALNSRGIVIACGMAKYENDARTAEVFDRADRKMYENKKALKAARSGNIC